MINSKKTAIIVGLLFLTTNIAFFLGKEIFIGSTLNAADYLVKFSANYSLIIIGMLLEFFCDIGVCFIAFLMFPILKKQNESMALGYIGFRIIEATIFIIGVFCPLLLISLSQNYIKIGNPDINYFQTLGTLLINGKNMSYQIAIIFSGIGGMILCYLMYDSKLIPRLLSCLGFIGYAMLLIGSILEIFGLINTNGLGMIINIPLSIFEIILLPFWLIVKGFSNEKLLS